LIAQALTNSTTSVVLVGSVTWNGSQAIQMHVTVANTPGLIVAPPFEGLGEFDLYLDPTSARVQGLAQRIWWSNDLRQSYLHEIIFSNYQTANGLSVPFTIAEKIDGQETWVVTLSSLVLNSGLSDDLFEVQSFDSGAQS